MTTSIRSLLSRSGLLICLSLALLYRSGLAAAVTVKTWTPGETLTAADLNATIDGLTAAMVDVSSDQTIAGVKTFATVVADPTYGVGATTTAFTTTSQTLVAVPGLVATVTTHGKPVLITVNTNHNTAAVPTTGATGWAVWTVTRDSTDLGGTNGMQITEHYLQMNMPVAITYVDTPAAGTHSYIVEMRVGGANMAVQAGESGQRQQITATELN